MAGVVSREAYFQTGLDVLSDLGYGGLKLAEVCNRLGVTTGSFYHYFSGWPAYTRELLENWMKERHGSRHRVPEKRNRPAPPDRQPGSGRPRAPAQRRSRDQGMELARPRGVRHPGQGRPAALRHHVLLGAGATAEQPAGGDVRADGPSTSLSATNRPPCRRTPPRWHGSPSSSPMHSTAGDSPPFPRMTSAADRSRAPGGQPSSRARSRVRRVAPRRAGRGGASRWPRRSASPSRAIRRRRCSRSSDRSR